MDRNELLRASVLCSRSLRANLKTVDAEGRPRTLLVAGDHQFHSIWTRDFGFAAGGLMRIGEFQAVRDTLDELLAHQRVDGLFPYILDSYSRHTHYARLIFGSKIPLKKPLYPKFYDESPSNALIINAACRYALQADQPGWAGLVLPKLEAALAYENSRSSIVFFTQLQRWHAACALTDLLASLGRKRDAESRRSEASMLARRIDASYWDETRGFYHDTLERPLLGAESNLAAAAWGLASKDQAARIVRAIDRAGAWTTPAPLWSKALGLRVLGQTGRQSLLTQTFSKIFSQLDREDGVSETPTSWNAGMLLEAFHELLTTDEVSCESHS
ncbi:MAG: hypothetical protein COB53_02120 [Elusimicrobia bacterium]|nr:MAG: hypothetical protein COB53_02120 [Elusimicrobiota bacterium]